MVCNLQTSSNYLSSQPMTDKIIILDFGSQYTQLIGRALREQNVFCEILPYNKQINSSPELKGVILSGSPFSVNEDLALKIDFSELPEVPLLGICYGAQLMTKNFGGLVEKSQYREYGRSRLIIEKKSSLFEDVDNKTEVWMSHSDTIKKLPTGFELIGTTENIPVAAFEAKTKDRVMFGIQFHPEVYHSQQGKIILQNFAQKICHCKPEWTPGHFISDSVEAIKQIAGNKKVIMALSGGVDSTVAAVLIHKAIGENLTGIFVDNGLLRKDEFGQVLETYKSIGLNVKGVNAKDHFYKKLSGVTDPEQKRKIIGKCFIEIFDHEAHKLSGISFLGQGTIYPDVIESVSVHGPSVTIKSHHNVGGLPAAMKLKLIEPLRMLFKDEVRRVGSELGIPEIILQRHPFPGPGLGIRILEEVTEEKVNLLQQADAIFINALRKNELYATVWQAGAILLPVKSVGVMGDERTYEHAVALRAVTSVDGMTADWARLPYEFLADVSNEIINRVKGINRVVYDISSKPPATIEWE